MLNDLGSGSNVDLCVITKEGVEYKRNYEYLQVCGQHGALGLWGGVDAAETLLAWMVEWEWEAALLLLRRAAAGVQSPGGGGDFTRRPLRVASCYVIGIAAHLALPFNGWVDNMHHAPIRNDRLCCRSSAAPSRRARLMVQRACPGAPSSRLCQLPPALQGKTYERQFPQRFAAGSVRECCRLGSQGGPTAHSQPTSQWSLAMLAWHPTPMHA